VQRAVLGGGGHSRAAGVTTDGKISEIRKALVDAVHAELTKLTKA